MRLKSAQLYQEATSFCLTQNDAPLGKRQTYRYRMNNRI